ncbi:SAVMC3_10250 family protein [Kribbella sp. NPDC050470]|uniref:SAVMC3_10250 family protein n=1 Tax=unclassified Kribbella TaxID=2644121 RepID=UPI00379712F6
MVNPKVLRIDPYAGGTTRWKLTSMRELLFLSHAKLAQFHKRPGRLGGLSGGIGITAGVDALPTVEASASYDPAKERQAQIVDLDRAVEVVRKTWPVRWWAETDITPGEWVQFENRLNFGVIAGRDGTSAAGKTAALFWGNEEHGVRTSPRLLLHGSVRHLVPSNEDASVSTYAASLANYFFELVANPHVWNGEASPPFTGTVPSAIERAITAVSSAIPYETAAWMSGIARVTFDYVHRARPLERGLRGDVGPQGPPVRTVVASPLYVEYIPPPR